MLFSAYRKDDFADPEGFVAQLGAILENYSEDVILYVTSPHTGVQRTIKWPPSIAEVIEACSARERHLDIISRPERKVLPPPKEPTPKPGRISWREHKLEKHGRSIGPFEKPGDEWNRKSRIEQAAE